MAGHVHHMYLCPAGVYHITLINSSVNAPLPEKRLLQ
jgi:hypothetical protein